jgi:hypothetical protein
MIVSRKFLGDFQIGDNIVKGSAGMLERESTRDLRVLGLLSAKLSSGLGTGGGSYEIEEEW